MVWQQALDLRLWFASIPKSYKNWSQIELAELMVDYKNAICVSNSCVKVNSGSKWHWEVSVWKVEVDIPRVPQDDLTAHIYFTFVSCF